jgi:hypothetical protein
MALFLLLEGEAISTLNRSFRMRTSFRIIMVIVFALLVGVPRAHSATISATSCSQSDVQAAVNLANNGDTVNIPSGSCTWSRVLNVTKGVRITGSGSTNITGTAGGIITFNVTEAVCASTPYELDHINFINAYAINSSDSALVEALGTCQKFKIHDNTFDEKVGYAQYFILVNGYTYGVIYNNTFNQTGAIYQDGAISLKHTTWGGGLFGDGSWEDTPNLGTEKFLYAEGNTFIADSHKPFCDASSGARIVYRYNTTTNGSFSGHGFDSDNNGRGRGMRLSIAHNNILSDTVGYGTCMMYRAGTGLFYGNTINGFIAACIHADTYRDILAYGPNSRTGLSGPNGNGICRPSTTISLLCSNGLSCTTAGVACGSPGTGTCTGYSGQCSDGTGCNTLGAACSGGGICTNYSGPHYMCYGGNGTANGCCNPPGIRKPNPNCTAAASCVGGASACIGPVDNVAGNGAGWPCRDGVGQGQDSGLGTPQASEPLFVWSNTGASATLKVGAPGAVQNSDYFTDGSSCTSGVTSGLDSAKCAACTQGVGYWATDTRKLYRCGAGNTWSVYYTEYACPHPLTGLTGSCNGSIEGAGGYPSTSPVVTPPDNVRIVPQL